MIRSMTGFGRAEVATPARKIVVEIKSLNSKQLDLSVRMPSIYRQAEHEVRTMVSKALGRGKVDLSISYESAVAGANGAQGEGCGAINKVLFTQYFAELKALAAELNYDVSSEPLMQLVLRMPDVIQSQGVEIDKAELAALVGVVNSAIAKLQEFRAVEGRVLMDDLLERVATIESLMAQVVPFEGERIETVRARISENLAKITVTPDNNRFEQEIIYYLEKLDITEEKVRLAQHCNYFRQVAEQGEDAGRKLGFISQEMGREINTMGSKANHAQIQKLVVGMKDELEKIKEQLLNIL